MNIKFDKNTEWLKPFVLAAGKLVPLEKIVKIKSYKGKKHVTAYGSLLKEEDGVTFTLTIKTHQWSKTKKKYIEESKGLVLDTLAHELGHLIYWHLHDWRHFELQLKILKMFIPLVKKHNYTLW